MSLVGRLVGPYRILDALGEGGMGEVFLAEDTRLRRPVALKMLARRGREDVSSCERLAREARVASRLNHPGIAVVYETGTLEIDADTRAYIAMEYVAGESLQERLKHGPLAPEEALDLTLQLADALEEAHRTGVVHRDIKPGNVVLDGRRRAKLLDFGLASYTPTRDGDATWRGPEGVLPPGALAGTLAYMAPEQARGRSADARADVFGLGALLYELLAGHAPFRGESAVDVLDALLNAPPPPIAHAPGAPPLARALETVARRMLAKEPGDRYPGMAAVREALRAADGHQAEAAATPPPIAGVPAFANLTRRAEDDWIGTALAEAVAGGLRSLPGLEVVSRERLQEARRRLDLKADARIEEEAAGCLTRELGARWLVLGEFQRVADAIRIDARVVEGGAGTTVHARVDGTLSGIFAAQDQLVETLSRGLRGQLGDPALSEGAETRVVEAYEAFTRGVVNLRAQTRESLDRAIAFFEQALALDPGYFQAHVRLGVALDLKASALGGVELHRRAIASIRRALELKPENGEAWRELAGSQLSLGQDAEALASAQRSVELDPSNAATHAMLARARFIGFGEFEAAADGFDRALELNPEAGWYALMLSLCAALLGQLDRAEAAARRALVLQEGFLSGRQGLALVGAFVRLGQVAALQGRPLDAVELFRREEEFVLRVGHALAERILIEIRYRIGAALLQAERAEEGRRELLAAVALHEERLRLGADDPFTRFYAACARALLGDEDGAAGDLERALEARRAYVLRRARSQPELARILSGARLRGWLEAAS